MKFIQGKFTPTNPQKYVGNVNAILYRSSWELKLFKYLDRHPSVINWNSEEIVIPYISIDNRQHRYLPDVIAKFTTRSGTTKTVLIEVKPKSQTVQPKKGKKRQTTYINEMLTWGKNEAKWSAARIFCEKQGWEFVIMTEENLGIIT